MKGISQKPIRVQIELTQKNTFIHFEEHGGSLRKVNSAPAILQTSENLEAKDSKTLRKRDDDDQRTVFSRTNSSLSTVSEIRS